MRILAVDGEHGGAYPARSMSALLADQLASAFTGAMRERGAALLAAQAVKLIRQEPGFLLGEVIDGRTYDVGLRWSTGQARTEAACTCAEFPDKNACAHLWAAILARAETEVDAAIEEPNAAPVLTWEQRLADLAPPQSKRLRDPWEGVPPGHERLVFVIGTDKSLNRAQVVVRIYCEKRLKTGRFGSRKPLEIDPWRAAPARDPRDEQILALLQPHLQWIAAKTQARSTRTPVPTAPLEELQSQLLLPMLCETGRLYLEVGERKASRPLSWDAGEPWDLHFELTRDEEVGECVLTGALTRAGERIGLEEPWLFIGSAWFLTENRVARFQAHGGLGWAEELRRHGALRVPLDEESQLLRTLLEARGTPAVSAAGVRWTPEAPPKPVLWIGRKVGRAENLDARLYFEYQGLRVRASEELALLKLPGAEGSLATLVRRDFAAERQRASELLSVPGIEATEVSTERDAMVDPARLVDLVRRLLDSGWTVDAEGLRWRRSGRMRYSVRSSARFFELIGGLDFEGQSASFPALLEAARAKSRTVKLGDGSIGILPEKWLEDWELFERLSESGEDSLRFERSQAWVLDALLEGRENVDFDREFAQFRDRALKFEGLQPRDVPPGFQGELRPYQRETLAWLCFLEELGIGGCLADDMGLGKTVQLLAYLEQRRLSQEKDRRPTLVVAPRSLCFHWMQEAAQFTPQLRCTEYTGSERKARLARLAQHDLVVTTYGTVRQDIEELSKLEFDCVVLDEAQAIKNPLSLASRAVRLLRARQRIALTGTPVENHLGDLWSIFEFLNPGMLGSVGALRYVDMRTELPPADDTALQRLSHALRPFILRRTKEQVLVDLPSKSEQTLMCTLEGRQRSEYDELHAHYRRALASGDLGMGGLDTHVLEALLRLRQAACHPGLIDPQRVGDSSAKLETLLGMLEEVAAAGHKALVFSQFTSFLAILRSNLDARGWNYEYLDGSTDDRGAHVARFQNDPACTLFLISLKAGGFGLNLTAADYVFLLDPWWNPAVETQAIDRAHRIGQTRSVIAYRLVARGTIEERVLELQAKKRVVAESLLGADKQAPSGLTRADLELLFA